MPPIRSIAILLHERQRNALVCNYRIWPVAENWRARGIRVDLVWGIGREAEADLLIPHLDVSYIPDDYWAFIQRHPNVANRAVRDIRKTRYSANLVRAGDVVDGPVIVKTVGNCGGFGDEWLGGPPLTIVGRVRRRLARVPWVERRGLRWIRTLSRYPIFDSVRDVPRGVFKNPHLFVERFLPERQGDQYTCRLWNVLGDGSLGRVLTSTDPLVKSSGGRLLEGPEPPPEIVRWREKLGLDYGKMDYVFHDGQAILIDVNTTPTVTGAWNTPQHVARSAGLAAGISYFERQAR